MVRTVFFHAGNNRAGSGQDRSCETALHEYDLMVSDWSGTALEYAFALERPVIFVDVPYKVNTGEYTRLDCRPLEAHIRDAIGAARAAGQIDTVGQVASDLCDTAGARAEPIPTLRNRYLFNVGNSAVRSGEILAVRGTRVPCY